MSATAQSFRVHGHSHVYIEAEQHVKLVLLKDVTPVWPHRVLSCDFSYSIAPIGARDNCDNWFGALYIKPTLQERDF